MVFTRLTSSRRTENHHSSIEILNSAFLEDPESQREILVSFSGDELSAESDMWVADHSRNKNALDMEKLSAFFSSPLPSVLLYLPSLLSFLPFLTHPSILNHSTLTSFPSPFSPSNTPPIYPLPCSFSNLWPLFLFIYIWRYF